MNRSAAPVLVSFVLILALAACASAPRERQGPDKLESGRVMKPAALLFATFDDNHDFQISPAELEAGLARAFDGIDADGDERISLLELSRWNELVSGSESARPGRFDFDVNADSVITRDEFYEAMNNFARRYAGADGIIQFAELSEEAGIGDYMRRREPELMDDGQPRRRGSY